VTDDRFTIDAEGEVLLTGRARSIDADYQVTSDALDATGQQADSIVRVGRPHRQIAFGPRDRNVDGYERAREIALENGFEPVERTVGGRAVAYTGTTVAFVRTQQITDPRQGLSDRYDPMVEALGNALDTLDVDAQAGEPDRSFCPGAHSLQAEGKLVGVAQRVTKDVSLVSGIVVVRDHEQIGRVLQEIYAALDIPFDPTTVGSVAKAGGPADPQATIDAVSDALLDGENPSIVRLEEQPEFV
jgi:lipoate-protein ligase A